MNVCLIIIHVYYMFVYVIQSSKPAYKTENFLLVKWLRRVILSRTYWNAVSGLLSLKSAQTVYHYQWSQGRTL